MSSRIIARFALLVPLWAAVGGCVDEATELTLATPNRQQFEAEVYPVLLRDCAFHACHGSTDRFLQVFGPGRGRMTANIKPLDPELPLEIDHAYDRARSMIDAREPERSLLLKKPLETKAGGQGHEGSDGLGRNVYQSKSAPGYDAIRRWVLGAGAAAVAPTTSTTPANAIQP